MAKTAMEINTTLTDEIVCPHCGHEFSDSWDVDGDQVVKCAECGEEFEAARFIHVSYTSQRVESKAAC